jgi:hypothetical protein
MTRYQISFQRISHIPALKQRYMPRDITQSILKYDAESQPLDFGV